MKFHVLLPIRDEADIIGECLRHLLVWADTIYVFDTGSVDATWEVVRDLAVKEKRLKPLRKDPVYFSEMRLRGWLFNEARKDMCEGDWFLRADADEFHHIPPPEFLKTRMRPHETIAYHQYYDFRLTASEVSMWERGKETMADRRRPIADRRRWFIPSTYSEPRMCRYRERMQWPSTVSFPFNAGFVAHERLPIRHYPHRDPAQLQRRCRLRAVMFSDPMHAPGSFPHWLEAEWRKFITPDDLPQLRYWQPGTQLPEFHFTNHLARPHLRGVQRAVHAFLLPWLDRLRAHWLEDAYPERLAPEVTARLAKDLGVQDS